MQAESTTMLDQVEKAFSKQVSPYNETWPPIKDGERFDLARGLRNSFKGSYTPTSAKIESPLKYAIYHQYGTKHLPARKMIPEEGKGFGNWKGPILTTARKVLKSTMDGTYQPSITKSETRSNKAAKKIIDRINKKAAKKFARADAKKWVKDFVKKQLHDANRRHAPKPKMEQWQKVLNMKKLVRELG